MPASAAASIDDARIHVLYMYSHSFNWQHAITHLHSSCCQLTWTSRWSRWWATRYSAETRVPPATRNARRISLSIVTWLVRHYGRLTTTSERSSDNAPLLQLTKRRSLWQTSGQSNLAKAASNPWGKNRNHSLAQCSLGPKKSQLQAGPRSV